MNLKVKINDIHSKFIWHAVKLKYAENVKIVGKQKRVLKNISNSNNYPLRSNEKRLKID